jgi:hypothetical protein
MVRANLGSRLALRCGDQGVDAGRNAWGNPARSMRAMAGIVAAASAADTTAGDRTHPAMDRVPIGAAPVPRCMAGATDGRSA